MKGIVSSVESERKAFLPSQCPVKSLDYCLPPSPANYLFFNLVAVKEELPQDRPTVNQTQAEVITEQANLNTSAARSSKVLYVITTSPSHPPQTVPGSNSWASSMGAGSHRVEGSVVGDDRNRSALGCFREARWGVGSVICEGTSSH